MRPQSSFASKLTSSSGVLAAKRRWQNARKAAGKPYDKPNVRRSLALMLDPD